MVQTYAENMRIVEALGRQYGFQSLFYWQPVVFSKRQTPFEAERADQYGWLAEPFAAVVGGIGETVDDVGRARFRDLSHLLDHSNELLFLDFCHTTEAANRQTRPGDRRGRGTAPRPSAIDRPRPEERSP